MLLSWRNEPLVRKFSKSQEIVLENPHRKWLENRISSLHLAPFFIAWSEISPIGYVRFDPVAENEFDISYFVDTRFRGQGLGKRLVLESIREFNLIFPNSTLNAWVNNQNIASQKTFENLNFDLAESAGNFKKYQKLSE
jgi:RimJ/RimL family protein N-acetyltransferase